MKDESLLTQLESSRFHPSSFGLHPFSWSLFQLSYAVMLVAAEGVEPTSLDYQSSALPLSYTAKIG